MKKSDDEIQSLLDTLQAPQARDGFFEEIEAKVATEPVPSTPKATTDIKWKRRVLAAAVPVAAAIIATVLLANANETNSDSTSRQQVAVPETTTTPVTELKPLLAAEVLAKSSLALSDIKNLSGHVVFVQHPYPISVDGQVVQGSTVEENFVINSDGDYKIDAAKGSNESGGPQLESYNATSGTYRVCWNPGSRWSCSTTEGVNDSYRYMSHPQFWNASVLSSTVRVMTQSENPSLDEVLVSGRKGWKLTGSFPKGLSYGGITDRATIVIDQETLVPLQIDTFDGQRPVLSVTLTDVNLNQSLVPADFGFKTPAGAQINPTEGTPSRTTVARVNAQAGYAVLAPANVPNGYVGAEISFVRELSTYGDLRRNNVIRTYRRGVDSFSLVTHSRANGADYDPNSRDSENVLSNETVMLGSGAFKGVKATITTTPEETRIWGQGQTLVFGISGNLTKDELIKAAESLTETP